MESMEKNPVTLKLISLYRMLAVLSLLSCGGNISQPIGESNHAVDTLILKPVNLLSYEYDNHDSARFGVQFFGHGFPIGQPSLVLSGSNVFVVDAFYNNVKKIDLVNGNIWSSKKLSPKQGELYDIIVFKELLYISGDRDAIFVIDKSLQPLKQISLKKGKCSFTRTFGIDSLVLFCPDSHEYVTLNRDDKIVGIKKVSYAERGSETYFKNKMLKQLDEGTYLSTFGIIMTSEDLFQNEVDFDSSKVVQAKQDTSGFKLVVFDFQKQ